MLTELIVTQSVDQLQETLIPYCLYKMKVRNRKTEVETKMEKYEKEALKPEYEVSYWHEIHPEYEVSYWCEIHPEYEVSYWCEIHPEYEVSYWREIHHFI